MISKSEDNIEIARKMILDGESFDEIDRKSVV